MEEIGLVIASRGTTPGIELATTWQNYEGTTSFRPKDWMETIAKKLRSCRFGRAAKVATAILRPEHRNGDGRRSRLSDQE